MEEDRIKKLSLEYHQNNRPGKIQVVPTKKHATQADLAKAYSPGVAYPCLEIKDNISDVYKYTAKGNLVAVISNGTAVLGLGDIGPEASKPVMEGKGLLFKIFADIDVFDIEIKTKDIEEFVNTVKNIAPTFGGINLEDIKAPEAFEIERRLKEELDIPVMHDDQHGTAIISAAGLINALELVNKDISKVKIVVNGAGAAAISCVKLYLKVGANINNIFILDSKGILTKNRNDLSEEKIQFAQKTKFSTLDEIIQNADVFIGLSRGDVFTPDMLMKMNQNPIVFALANPTPEIDYELAIATREDVIVATGRSDYPNQVNNVLGFPYIFRGALDVRATSINDEMKLAAVYAISALTKETVPESINKAYSELKISFDRNYIIPKPFDPRLINVVSIAVAKAAIKSGVAQIKITDWKAYEEKLIDSVNQSNKFVRLIQQRAKRKLKRIVYPEADQLNVMKAAHIVFEEKIGIPILLGNKNIINDIAEEIGFDISNIEIWDLVDQSSSVRIEEYSNIFWKNNDRKGITKLEALKLMRARNYFGPMMVQNGHADCMVIGYSTRYPVALRPILNILNKKKNVSKLSTTNILVSKKGPLFFADTSIIENPESEDLVNIAINTAELVKLFSLKPKIAMLSYTNFSSSKSSSATKIRAAVKYLHKNHPNIQVDGEIQADFALNADMMMKNFPFNKLAENIYHENVNTFIFPNLESSNIMFKMLKELYEMDNIGPIIMGLEKSAHIIHFGASVDEIVNLSAVATIVS